MELEEFRKRVLKANKKKHHFKVRNSNGTKQAWRWIKKNKWLNISQPITELEFGTIIKAINSTLQDKLLEGKDVLLPNKMGRLEIRKSETKIDYKEGKLYTNLPIDWKKTISLWWEDKDYYKSRTLIRHEIKERFKIYYNKKFANYNNKSFYEFMPTRALRIKLKQQINNGRLDALLLSKRNELYKY